jgi:hypothetical protein
MRDTIESREEDGDDSEFSIFLGGAGSDRVDLGSGILLRTFLGRERGGTSSEVEEDVDDVLILRRFVGRKRFALLSRTRETDS